MALFGLVTAMLAAIAADLKGNESTRWFTRRAFGAVVLVDLGVNASGLASFGADLWGVVPL